MDVIILAGGFGTRLAHVISNVPKPMAPVGGRPFLEYILKNLSRKGIKRVILAVGYKKEVIVDYFKYRYENMELIYSDEDKPLFTGGAVKKALSLCDSMEVLILNGDTYFDVDIDKMYAMHLKENADATIATKKVNNSDRYGSLNVVGNRIIAFNEKKPKENSTINGGVYVVKKDILSSIKEEKFSLGTDFFEQKVKQLKLVSFSSNSYFIDIGIEQDYKKAQIDFEMEKIYE